MHATEEAGLKISALARDSGVSKELIHHYLREGLLPPPPTRARYDARHLRLLRLIKRLREERFLPLPVIREIVSFQHHDPDRIEIVLLSGGAPAGPGPAALLTRDELHARTGAPRELVDRCIAVGLVRWADGPFTVEDANIVSLVQRGTQMGIPFDSFRTIRSYVEIAFDLERASFLPRTQARPDLGELAREFAARKEIASGFVQNVLSALANDHLRRALDESAHKARTFGASLYRPSDAFRRKHGIDAEIDRLREQLTERPAAADVLLRLARLFALAGRHHEAVFTIEQAPASFRELPEAARLHGWSLLLGGEADRALEVLERAAKASPSDPVATVYLAAARFAVLGDEARVERALGALQAVVGLAQDALDRASDASAADAAEVRLVGGLLLSSLPSLCETTARGIAALQAAHRAAAAGAHAAIRPASLRLRVRLASAIELHRALDPATPSPRARARRERLLREVLCLDPASVQALELYLGRAPGGTS